MKGLFIVFEGLDGSGTSTQAELLEKYFLAQGKKAVVSPEPTSGPVGKLIREILSHKELISMENSSHFDEQLSYLFAADRYFHLYNAKNGVIKLLQNNTIVISTRYVFSSLVYHAQEPGDFAQIKFLNQKFFNPDLVIYLDIPLEIALLRLKERPIREVYEYEEKLIKVKNNYNLVFNNYDGLLLKIEANDEVKNIHQNITKFIEKELNVSTYI